jgi:hypothetical protein
MSINRMAAIKLKARRKTTPYSLALLPVQAAGLGLGEFVFSNVLKVRLPSSGRSTVTASVSGLSAPVLTFKVPSRVRRR